MTTDQKAKANPCKTAAAVEADRRKAKDAILLATLDHVAFDGWTRASLVAGTKDAGFKETDVDRLFAGEMRELAEHFSDWADRTMLLALGEKNMAELKIREKIATAVRTRLEIFAPYREAIRRMIGFLSLPQYGAVGAKATYNAVDAMWYAAGDRAADFSFYSKRATLAAVYGSTVLFWLSDESDGFAETWAFLDRRIENVMQIPKVRGKLKQAVQSLPNPFRAIKDGLEKARL